MRIRTWGLGALFYILSLYATEQVELVIPQLDRIRIQEKQKKIAAEIEKAIIIQRGAVISAAAITLGLAYWYFYKSSHFASPYRSVDELVRDFRNLPTRQQRIIIQAGAAQLESGVHTGSWRSFFASLTVQAASGILSGVALRTTEPIIERVKARVEEMIQPFFAVGSLEWYLNRYTSFSLVKDVNNELAIDDTFIKSLELHIKSDSLDLLIAGTSTLLQQVEGVIAFMQYRLTLLEPEFQDYVQKIINHLEGATSLFTARLQELVLKGKDTDSSALQEQLLPYYTTFTQELAKDLIIFYAVGN